MNQWVPIFLTAAAVTFAAIYAVAVDRFRNPVTGTLVLIAGFLPWIMVSMILDSLPQGGVLGILGLFGSGPLFFGALLRYWLGPQFPNWEKASCAMVVGILLSLGFFISMFAGGSE